MINKFTSIFITKEHSLSYDELQLKILCLLFYFGKKISFYELGDKFGICKATAYNWCIHTINLILKYKNEFLKLPHPEDFYELSEGFCNLVI